MKKFIGLAFTDLFRGLGSYVVIEWTLPSTTDYEQIVLIMIMLIYWRQWDEHLAEKEQE